MITQEDEAINTYEQLILECDDIETDLKVELMEEVQGCTRDSFRIKLKSLEGEFSELSKVHTARYETDINGTIPKAVEYLNKGVTIICDRDGRAFIADGNHRYNTYIDRHDQEMVNVVVIQVEKIPDVILGRLYSLENRG